ncbi:MAG: hypothetical protein JST67_02985 [Bacteroidetes bacterium]|nr:hypothetical protein [Bacteroidota bacterium]
MKKLFGIILFFATLLLLSPTRTYAQKNFHENTKGGRKKEAKNQVRVQRVSIFKRKKSAGNADAFASHKAGAGFFYRLFHSSSSTAPKNASLRKTKPGKVQDREQKRLFRRNASKTKLSNERFQSRQRKDRARNRSRGGSFN